MNETQLTVATTVASPSPVTEQDLPVTVSVEEQRSAVGPPHKRSRTGGRRAERQTAGPAVERTSVPEEPERRGPDAVGTELRQVETTVDAPPLSQSTKQEEDGDVSGINICFLNC